MATFLELSKGTEKLLTQTEVLLRKLDYQSAADNVREHLKAFGERELTVVVAGEARRGKSSLLNALLGETESIFPVDIDVCTNVVTLLRYGETEQIEVYIDDPRSPQGYRIDRISRNEIGNYVSEKGNANNYKNVKMLKAAVPNELLKEGVVFVDTPGVGSLNVEHAEATYGFLPNADLLLFVTDADRGMSETELDFLRRGYSYCKSVIFPLTKKDLNPNYEIIAEDNRAKVSNALEIPAEQVQIIPVSSIAKLEYLKTGRMRMYANSNFQALEDCIWSTIAKRRGEVLLLPYLAAAKAEITKLLDNVVAQYQTLGSAVTEDLIAELNDMVAKLNHLQDTGADWRNELNKSLTLLQTSVNAQQQTIALKARDLVDERIRDMDRKICKPDNYKQLISDVNDVITRGLLDIREMIADETSSKMDELQTTLDMQLDSNEAILSKLQFRPANLEIQFPKKSVADQLVTKGRNFTMNTMGGATIGALLGGVIACIIGGPVAITSGAALGGEIGTLFGGTKGCIEVCKRHDQLDVNAVKNALTRHITASMTTVGSNVSSVLAEIRIELTSSYEKQLKKRVKELQENIGQLKKNISLAQNELPKRKSELKGQITQCNQIVKYYEAVMLKVTGKEIPAQQEEPAAEQEDSAVKQLPAPEAQESAPAAVQEAAPAKEEASEQEEVTYSFL